MYKPRNYRRSMAPDGLVSFEVMEAETDLAISADTDLCQVARQAIINYRLDIENYIKSDPRFFSSLEPINVAGDSPAIVKAMAEAAKKASVGPMAAVAGALAEFVGTELLKYSKQVIIENGGDIFMHSLTPRIVGVYTGEDSLFKGKLSVRIDSPGKNVGICTSSGTVSHSLSFGKADAALLISHDAALADAAATAVGNIVKNKSDIEKGICAAKSIPGIDGVLIVIGDKMGSWGHIELV